MPVTRGITTPRRAPLENIVALINDGVDTTQDELVGRILAGGTFGIDSERYQHDQLDMPHLSHGQDLPDLSRDGAPLIIDSPSAVNVINAAVDRRADTICMSWAMASPRDELRVALGTAIRRAINNSIAISSSFGWSTSKETSGNQSWKLQGWLQQGYPEPARDCVICQKLQEGTGSNTLLRNNDGSNVAPVDPTETIERPKSSPLENLTPTLKETPIQELWNVAYEKLRLEDGALIEEYESKLQGNLFAGLSQTIGLKTNTRDRMHAILLSKMDEVNKNIWKLRFGGSEVPVRDLVQPVLAVVNCANEYINSALKANPYASMAWAGISLLLPLFMNPSTQNASLVKGLEYISSLIAQSRMREEIYAQVYESGTGGHESFQRSHGEYKIALERLYRQILRFQAKSYCYYSDNSAFRLGHDVIKWNDWDQLVNGVREQEQNFINVDKLWRDMQSDEERLAAESRHQEAQYSRSAIDSQISALRKAIEDTWTEGGPTDLYHWLCTIDPSAMYNAARDRHETGTCEWLVKDSKEFKTWKTSPRSLLWLHGKAGSGKSILSSSAIKHLRDQCASDPFTTLAYFYFSFSDREKQKVDGMLASLIKQICSCRPNVPQLVQQLTEYKNRGEHPDTRTLEAMLIASVLGFSGVYIVIDALDECPVLGEQRGKLLKSLCRILGDAPDNLHILFTSRKEPDIDIAIRTLLSPPSRIEVDLLAYREILNRDIYRYIDATLATDDYQSWPESIKELARKSLIEKADGMFQYVRCQFEILQKLSSLPKIEGALQNLPTGLDAIYDRIFENIDANFQAQVINSLKWLAFEREVLTVSELSEIFIIRLDNDVAFNEAERLFSVTDVLKYFSGLIITYGNSSNYVRLAHFSIKEYLTSSRIVGCSVSAFSFTEVDAHLYIMIPRASWPAKIAQDVALALAIRSQSLAVMIMIDEEIDKNRDHMLLQPSCYTARRGFRQLTKMLISQEPGTRGYITQGDLDMTLQDAAYAGRIDVVQLLLKMDANINAESAIFGDALQAAVYKGHTAVVTLLLDHGAEVNAQRGKWGSALQAAAARNYLSVMKLLDGGGRTALHWAAARGSMGHFNMLLERGANVNALGGQYGTVLQIVCTKVNAPGRLEGYGSVRQMADAKDRATQMIKALLERGADINLVGGWFGTALQAACATIQDVGGATQIIQLLIERGADVNIQGGRFGTALQAACWVGAKGLWGTTRNDLGSFKAVVELLLKNDALVNSQGGKYGTALCAAIESKHPDAVQVIKLLLDKGAAEVNQQGTSNLGTALHFACKAGDKEVVCLLLDHGADVNAQGGQLGTPLHATLTGHYWSHAHRVMMVELLLNKGAKINQMGGEYGTALQAACSNQRVNVETVRLLLDRGAHVNAKGGKYGTALAVACRKESYSAGVVQLLLERGADANAEGGEYGTALAAACAQGDFRIETVKLLLERGADVNAEGGKYGTALATACANKYRQIETVKLLLGSGANVHLQECAAWHRATHLDSRNDDVLKLFLEHGVDINHVHGEYGTALNTALNKWPLHTWNGNSRGGKVCFLLEHGADADIMTGRYGFALQTACATECDLSPRLYPGSFIPDINFKSVKTKYLLESCPDINANAQGGVFGSALQAAAYSGQAESTTLLLNRGADANARGGKYGCALNAAIIRGYWHIVKILLEGGATPDCHQQQQPDEDWLQRVREEHGEGAIQRYRKFWEVEKDLKGNDSGENAEIEGSGEPRISPSS
ncbi:Ankyrin-3-like protein [Cladobotryum mycophilum]|uniref:Ankyrin-3-like protein n=1 Tax=Cladobotryum mycophilum TaxID=491253 RepID=A0ABR0SCH5_9HYPO